MVLVCVWKLFRMLLISILARLCTLLCTTVEKLSILLRVRLLSVQSLNINIIALVLVKCVEKNIDNIII